jgi:hypothetical protein
VSRSAERGGGEHAKDVFDVQAEAADEVSSAFPEGQTVVGVAVEGASSYHFVVDSVVVGAVVEEAVEEGMYSLGSGSKSRAGVLGVVLEVVDIEDVIVGSKVAVTGVAWAEA